MDNTTLGAALQSLLRDKSLQLSMQSIGQNMPPQLGAGLSMPLAGGELGLDGRYQRPLQGERPEWSAMLNYNRKF